MESLRYERAGGTALLLVATALYGCGSSSDGPATPIANTEASESDATMSPATEARGAGAGGDTLPTGDVRDPGTAAPGNPSGRAGPAGSNPPATDADQRPQGDPASGSAMEAATPDEPLTDMAESEDTDVPSDPAGATGDPAQASDPQPNDPQTADAVCDRDCLTEHMTAYLEALIQNDASGLPLAEDAKFTENGAELSLTEGLWGRARSLDGYRQDFAEVPAGQAAAFVRLTDDRGAVLLAVRLRISAGEISEIESIVARSGEATFFSPTRLSEDPALETAVDTPLPRDRLVEITDLYFQGLDSGDGSDIPVTSRARRNENGIVTATGSGIRNVAMFSYIEEIKRRYVLVDEERGIVLPFVLFEIPNGFTGSRTLHLAELFKIEDDQIADILAIMVNQPLGTPSGWE